MSPGESYIRAKLIDPVLHARGSPEDLTRREETAPAVDIVDNPPRRAALIEAQGREIDEALALLRGQAKATGGGS